jgi:hypothetical protein
VSALTVKLDLKLSFFSPSETHQVKIETDVRDSHTGSHHLSVYLTQDQKQAGVPRYAQPDPGSNCCNPLK